MKLAEKEQEARLLELKKMILPEMVPNLLKSLGIKLPENENNALLRLSQANYKGMELLRIIEGRMHKCFDNGCQKSIQLEGLTYETEISNIEHNLSVIDEQLNHIKRNINKLNSNFDWTLFDSILETALWIGYHSGAHDMKIPIERHANSGFISNVLRPQSGGEKTASKFIPIQHLIKVMAEFIIHSNIDLKIYKAGLARMIQTVIMEFSNSETNNNLEALTPFQKRYPSGEFILKQLGDYDFSSAKDMKKLSEEKIIELLRKKFSPAVIKKLIFIDNQ